MTVNAHTGSTNVDSLVVWASPGEGKVYIQDFVSPERSDPQVCNDHHTTDNLRERKQDLP